MGHVHALRQWKQVVAAAVSSMASHEGAVVLESWSWDKVEETFMDEEGLS